MTQQWSSKKKYSKFEYSVDNLPYLATVSPKMTVKEFIEDKRKEENVVAKVTKAYN